ncbi:MAG: T9SS type A sorting domain-containing protein [Chitinophagaceae bacterium]
MFLSFVLLISISSKISAQIKWDGEAGDGKWASAANWVGNTMPGASDNVILDNSIVTNSYTVTLPATAVTIQFITIAATTGNNVQLLLPASNSLAPAFTVTGSGNAINISSGGILLNSSGANSGAAIVINGSLKIDNGGQYTHNTRTSHAALVAALSQVPGTEQGIFKFDVPGGGYTFSASNRTYGSLVFSADASSGTQTYSASGSGAFTINGDLVINAGATINLDLTDVATTTIKGNYLQQGGVFNIASQPNNNTVYIQGDVAQTAGSITESSTGLPTIELNGSNQQRLQIAGTISNSVSMRINNRAGASLLTNVLLPYKLVLSKGIVNCNGFLLTLLTGCSFQADSLATDCFINGALRKEGLVATDHFLFPVGKGITQRWLELKNATGNYTVEFFKLNPNALSAITGNGIHHISSIEYWSVVPDITPSPSTQIELSFDNVNSGGVTSMPALRVAQLKSGIWDDAGNTTTTGIAGAAGSVVSNPINTFETGSNYFTLASADAHQNPLPILLQSFTAEQQNQLVLLKWKMTGQWLPAYFEVQSSVDGRYFETLAKITAINGQIAYQYADNRTTSSKHFYRLKMTNNSGEYIISDLVLVNGQSLNENSIAVWPSLVSYNATLVIRSSTNGNADMVILDTQGRIVRTERIMLSEGVNNIPLILHTAKAGVYTITVIVKDKTHLITRFIKQP